jgi:MFS family permease
MRRLVALVSIVVLVDTALYAVLTPLLPRFADELDLSKALAGVLVAAYPLGALVGGLPGGFAAVRLGPRRAVLVGLGLFAVASVGFAAADAYATLLLARFVQGAGSALTWAGAFSWLIGSAPRSRRGELVGAAFAAAIVGALLGPALGALAASVGRGPVFISLAGLAGALAVAALAVPPLPGTQPSLRALGGAFRQRRFLGGLASMALPALLFGVLGVLAPLHLHAAGWSAAAIGVLWIVGAAAEAVEAPLVGRVSDRRGRTLPVRVALAAGAVLSAALAFGGRPLVYVPLVFLATVAYSVLFTPALALIADGADDAGLAQGLAFGLMNAAWAVGAVVGPLVGGALASATSDAVPFALAAALCLSAFFAVGARPRVTAAALARRVS